MAVTTDPLNFVLESVRSYLNSNVTDPVSNRASNSPFISVGPTLVHPQYPLIRVSIRDFEDTADAGLGGVISGGDQGVELSFELVIQVFTQEEVILGSMSNDELIRNLGSQIMFAMLLVSGKQILGGSFDIKQLSLVTTEDIVGPDENGELQFLLLFDCEFLWRY